MYSPSSLAELQSCPSCQKRLNPAEKAPSFCLQCRFPLMLIANKYRLVRTLSEGGFGVIYEAHHIRMEQDPKRAIKVIKPDVLAIPGMQKRFYREVQVTSAISQTNPHIIRIYDDFGEIPNLGHFYVMEHLQGHNLRDLLEHNHGLLPLELVITLFLQLCNAIHAAHQGNIIHRDLKPENLFITQQVGTSHFLKVLDFGIAKPVGAEGNKTNLTQGLLGTPAYMAPEQCLNKEISAQTDVYAMGIILYELLTGRTPFMPREPELQEQIPFLEVMYAHLNTPPPPLEQYLPSQRAIPPGLDQLLQHTLAKQPQQRPSVAQMEAELRHIFNVISHQNTYEIDYQPTSEEFTPDPNLDPYMYASDVDTHNAHQHTPQLPYNKLHTDPSPANAEDTFERTNQELSPTSPYHPLDDEDSTNITPPSHNPLLDEEDSTDIFLPPSPLDDEDSTNITPPSHNPLLDDAGSTTETTAVSAKPKPPTGEHLSELLSDYASSPLTEPPDEAAKENPTPLANINSRQPTPHKSVLQQRPAISGARKQKTTPQSGLFIGLFVLLLLTAGFFSHRYFSKQTAKPPLPKHEPDPFVPPPPRSLQDSPQQPTPPPTPRLRRRLKRKVPKPSAPPRARTKQRTSSPRFARLLEGCPKQPFFWIRLHLPKQHLRAPIQLSHKARTHKRPDGYCIGLTNKKSKLTIGGRSSGYLACTIKLWKRAKRTPTLRIKLRKEGGVEPLYTWYCLQN